MTRAVPAPLVAARTPGLEEVVRALFTDDNPRGYSVGLLAGADPAVTDPEAIGVTISEPPTAPGAKRERWSIVLPAVVRGEIVMDLLTLLRAELRAPIQRGEVTDYVAPTGEAPS